MNGFEMADDDGYEFVLSIDEFDTSVLPAHARIPGTDEFSDEVSRFYQKEFAAFKGNARIVVDSKTIHVSWRSDPNRPHPMQAVKAKLEEGDVEEAIRLLEILRRHQPDDDVVLYNLGLALSDSGQFDKAEQFLRHAVEVDSENINAQVALGVALFRQERYVDAIAVLREAVALEPTNPWAQRNLGGCFLKLGQIAEAEPCLRLAAELNPSDQQSLFGYAQVLHRNGEGLKADALYGKVIDLDARSSIADFARQGRTRLAQESFRDAIPGGVRSDAVMYLLDGLQKFEKMSRDEIQKIGFEIALMGQRGFDTNSPAQQYRLKSLPGQFSGLNLVCLMYVAFKQIAPQQDMSFDLTKEFEVATAMHKKGQ